MFRLCIPFPLVDLFTGIPIVMLATMFLVYRRSRQGNGQMDGNERLMLQLTVLAGFAVISFIFFVFAWILC